MAGALSIPFALLAFFNVSERLRFATLAYVSLWVLTISQARRISQLEKPPPHKLIVSPLCRMNDSNSVIVDLSLSNAGTAPAELHNVIGQFWTDQRFILRESTQPKVYHQAKVGAAIFAYYDLSFDMLHDNTTEPITQWTFRVPNQGEFI